MMSVSGGWFFVVASEAISVVGRDQHQFLPDVGSYIALAIQQANLGAMVAAGITLLLLVLFYDQVFFRPIVAWAEKFKFEQSEAQDTADSWMLTLLQRARLVHWTADALGRLTERLFPPRAYDGPGSPIEPASSARRGQVVVDLLWALGLAVAGLGLLYVPTRFMFGPNLGVSGGEVLAPNPNLNTLLSAEVANQFQAAGVSVGEDQTVYLSSVCNRTDNGTSVSPALVDLLAADGVAVPPDLPAACAAPLQEAGLVALADIGDVAARGLLTALRVIAMIVLSTLVWTPIGVWIGLRPTVAQLAQPVAQFAAAFPANLLFPIFVVLIAHFALNPEVWLSPLMVLGAQWYILFNVIAGTTAIPNDLKEAARVMGLRGWAWWRTLILPGIFPAFVTGGITASGGSWNASIVAEVASWGSTTLVATGLGAYIAHWSTGEFNPHVALGMLAMGLMVLGFNRLLWRRLYSLAADRFRLD
jgi:NitT/TauT family transport system permease protein